MYYIVEKIDQLERLSVSESAFVQLILCDSSCHPKLSSPSLLYYNNGEKGYVLCIDHSEGFSLPMTEVQRFLSKHSKLYLIDEKFHSYHVDVTNAVDLNLVMLDSNNTVKEYDCDTPFHRQIKQRHSELTNLDKIIPISKHYEACECFYDQVKYLMGLELDQTFDKQILDAYKYVEQSGIGVNDTILNKTYQLPNSAGLVRNSIAYSSYNLYNLTGRPTNSFGGVNFLAIPKEGDFRSCFVAKNDYLVEFDFDSYHLRLIAKLVSQKLPNSESIHKMLASQYFNKASEDITEEEYKQAKTITFRQLYGGIEDQYKHIEFLSSINEFVNSEYKKYKAQSSYVLPTGRVIKQHSSITKHKLFNYILQNLETKTNVEKIQAIKTYLLGKATQLVLITYDAFLFDFSIEDGKETLLKIKEILELGEFPTKHTYGKNYSFTQHF
jgi:hypothetical protein